MSLKQYQLTLETKRYDEEPKVVVHVDVAFNTYEIKRKYIPMHFKHPNAESVKLISCLLIAPDDAWQRVLESAYPPHD